MEASGRLRFFYLLEILKRETDEEHPLSAQELCALLAQRGVVTSRKSVYRDIAALNESGYEIGSTRQPRQGFFLMNREFELPEIRLLIDAVQSAPFLTDKKTAGLTQKLCELVSRPQSEQLNSQLAVERRHKLGNEEIYYTIDALHAAICARKKVKFRYYHMRIQDGRACRNEGREFTVSPYALLWDSDKYYLAANYEKYDTVANYRLDRMKHVRILDEPARPFEQVSQYWGTFDAADYLRRSFGMYRGDIQQVLLRCEDALLEEMLDRFDKEDLQLTREQNGFSLRARVSVSEGFVRWILQYGARVSVLEPDSLRERIANEAATLYRAYQIQAE